MTSLFKRWLLGWWPQLDRRVWILITGRLLSQLGTGFTLFYAPIFFVNQVGLTATAVGLGIGIGSVAGIVGRIVGGTMADSPRWGRRRTLLLSAIVSAIAAGILVVANDLSTFIAGNLLMGLGIGLYWPATESVVADLSTLEQRNEAFALTRLGDNLGLGLGVVFGGALISLTQNYRALFVIDGISFVIFFWVVYYAIAETLQPEHSSPHVLRGWMQALTDRVLLIFIAVNVLFTTYLAQVNSTLPLYFANFVSRPQGNGFSSGTISILFSLHVVLTALLQLPVARALNATSRPRALILSTLLWGMGFLLTGLTGVASGGSLVWAVLSLSVLAIATVAYMPSASALVVTLAPVSQRGIYLSINSLCWAVGYFIGPILGGWAMDGDRWLANGFWVILALTILPGLIILRWLEHHLPEP